MGVQGKVQYGCFPLLCGTAAPIALVFLCGATWVAQCADTPVFAMEEMLPAL